MIRPLLGGLAVALAVSISSAHAVAQQPARGGAVQGAKPAVETPARKEKDRSNPLGNIGTGNKEPINIDADRLDVYDKEQRAIFRGNVVAVQGETTIRCSAMTVFYERQSQGGQKGAGGQQRAQPASQGGSQNDSIKQIDCAGPVTVVSKDQVATSDNASFDRAANKVVLTGNAALSQCQNVTRGEKIVYDLNTQVANVETGPGGRVRALFVPNNDEDKQKQQACQQPQTASQPAQQAPAVAAGPKPASPAQTAAPKPAQKQRAQTN